MIGYWFAGFGNKGEAANYVFRPYLEAMFKDHASDPRILAWDMCNEPFQQRSGSVSGLVEAYLQTRKKLGATQPIGVSVGADAGSLQLVETCSDVLMIHPYFAVSQDWKSLKAFSQKHGKALLATECCWGAINDAKRTAIIRSDLDTLSKQKVGFLAHALHESLVADCIAPNTVPSVPQNIWPSSTSMVPCGQATRFSTSIIDF